MTIWRRCSLTKSTVCSTSTANLSVFKSFRVILADTKNLRGDQKVNLILTRKQRLFACRGGSHGRSRAGVSTGDSTRGVFVLPGGPFGFYGVSAHEGNGTRIKMRALMIYSPSALHRAAG